MSSQTLVRGDKAIQLEKLLLQSYEGLKALNLQNSQDCSKEFLDFQPVKEETLKLKSLIEEIVQDEDVGLQLQNLKEVRQASTMQSLSLQTSREEKAPSRAEFKIHSKEVILCEDKANLQQKDQDMLDKSLTDTSDRASTSSQQLIDSMNELNYDLKKHTTLIKNLIQTFQEKQHEIQLRSRFSKDKKEGNLFSLQEASLRTKVQVKKSLSKVLSLEKLLKEALEEINKTSQKYSVLCRAKFQVSERNSIQKRSSNSTRDASNKIENLSKEQLDQFNRIKELEDAISSNNESLNQSRAHLVPLIPQCYTKLALEKFPQFLALKDQLRGLDEEFSLASILRIIKKIKEDRTFFSLMNEESLEALLSLMKDLEDVQTEFIGRARFSTTFKAAFKKLERPYLRLDSFLSSSNERLKRPKTLQEFQLAKISNTPFLVYIWQQKLGNSFFSNKWRQMCEIWLSQEHPQIEYKPPQMKSNKYLYEGFWKNELQEGFGIELSFDLNDSLKHIYFGEFSAGLKEGNGTMIFTNGSLFTGAFKKNKILGKGAYFYADGGFYEGQLEGHRAQGYGTMIYEDGSQFTGEWKDDAKWGEGTFTETSGTKFSGKFEGNLRIGPVTIEFKSGDRYFGEYQGNVITGYGCYEYANEDRYDGDLINDKKYGSGIYFYSTGDLYEGDWYEDQRHGSGTYFTMSGDKYVGSWMYDQMEGEGVVEYPSGIKHIGSWVSGKKEGPGRRVYPNGDVFEGHFKADLIDCQKGILTKQYEDCQVIIEANWKENVVTDVTTVYHDESRKYGRSVELEGKSLEQVLELEF